MVAQGAAAQPGPWQHVHINQYQGTGLFTPPCVLVKHCCKDPYGNPLQDEVQDASKCMCVHSCGGMPHQGTAGVR